MIHKDFNNNYQFVRGNDAVSEIYESDFIGLSSMEHGGDFTRVLSLNTNFGVAASFVKKHLGAVEFDVLSNNGLLEQYSKNVCGESLEVDNFLDEVPNLDEYTCIMYEYINQDYATFLSEVESCINPNRTVYVYSPVYSVLIPPILEGMDYKEYLNDMMYIVRRQVQQKPGHKGYVDAINQRVQMKQDAVADEGVEESESAHAEDVGSTSDVVDGRETESE